MQSQDLAANFFLLLEASEIRQNGGRGSKPDVDRTMAEELQIT